MHVRSDVIVGGSVPRFINSTYATAFASAVRSRSEHAVPSQFGHADIRFSASPEWITTALAVGANVAVIHTAKGKESQAFCALQQTRRSCVVRVLEPVGSPIVDLFHPLFLEADNESSNKSSEPQAQSELEVLGALFETAATQASKLGPFSSIRLLQVPTNSPLHRAVLASPLSRDECNTRKLSTLRGPRLRLATGVGVPNLETEGRDFADVVNAKQRRQANSKLRAFSKDFPEVTEVHTTAEETRGWMPRLEAFRVARDRITSRGRELESGTSGSLWAKYLASVSDRLELFALRSSNELVAFNLVLQDGPAWRVIDGRISSDHASYGIGRIVHQKLTATAMNRSAVQNVEWGRGPQSYKSHVTTHVIETIDILWYSNWFAEFALLAPNRAKNFAKVQIVRFPAIESLTRQTAALLRRLRRMRREGR